MRKGVVMWSLRILTLPLRVWIVEDLRTFHVSHMMTSSNIKASAAVRTIVDLPDDQIELLKQLSERTRLSRAELMRRAVGEYLQRRKPGPDERAFGIWRDAPRDGLDYQRGLRDEWGS